MAWALPDIIKVDESVLVDDVPGFSILWDVEDGLPLKGMCPFFHVLQEEIEINCVSRVAHCKSCDSSVVDLHVVAGSVVVEDPNIR